MNTGSLPTETSNEAISGEVIEKAPEFKKSRKRYWILALNVIPLVLLFIAILLTNTVVREVGDTNGDPASVTPLGGILAGGLIIALLAPFFGFIFFVILIIDFVLLVQYLIKRSQKNIL